MEKALVCWSGGKDSALALYEIIQSQTYEVASLLTTIAEDYDQGEVILRDSFYFCDLLEKETATTS